MKRCTQCVIPDTRPDTAFIDGVCSACVSYAKRPQIDWDARRKELLHLLDRHDGRCIVPSSGGKDSHYQVLKLLEMGADVTIVTATTCHLTTLGRANIDNLSRYARTIEITPNQTVRRKLNRLGLELVGDVSWPEHVAIFTTPFKVAADMGIPLIFYGECPQEAYGGPIGTDQAKRLTERWRSEFGGFLGLRPSDMVGQMGITAKDMADYEMHDVLVNDGILDVEAHFLGQYFEWDSLLNWLTASKAGMQCAIPSHANWWHHENLDNAQTGLHDHMMFRKYGYGRGAAQISVNIRKGEVKREDAMKWLRDHDGWFPEVYAGVPFTEMIERIGLTKEQAIKIMDRFTNWDLFDRTAKRPFGVGEHWPILREFA